MRNERIPYWDFMRNGGGKEPHRDLELSTIEMSAMVKDMHERIKRLEEEVAWLRQEDTGLVTGKGIMD